MREIKFRAWVKNEDLFGKSLREKHPNGHMFTGFSFEDVDKGHAEANAWCESERWEEPDFRKAVLMQFTELHDKNGKEIYEGDICKREHQKGEDVGCIYFANGCFWYSPIESSERIAVGVLGPAYIGTFEIIGNIYEHPELLATPTN